MSDDKDNEYTLTFKNWNGVGLVVFALIGLGWCVLTVYALLSGWISPG